MAERKKSIAIDGPAGAGKSTLAKMIAEEFGFIHVDTGAIYRTVGLFIYRKGVPSNEPERVTGLLGEIDIRMKRDGGVQKMILNGKDVSQDIRLPEISICASDVSAMPSVRAFLLNMQREAAERDNVIMDGRDIGTVVLPEADLKIFLTADSGTRARRRLKELLEKGVETSFEEVHRDMQYRDQNDSTRSAAPLKPAEDAVILDTTDYSLRESFALLGSIVRERLGL